MLHRIETFDRGLDRTYVEWWDRPHRIDAGGHIEVEIRGVTNMRTSFGFNVYFRCVDGTDTLSSNEEAFTVQVPAAC